MEWAIPRHSRNQVNKAGEVLASDANPANEDTSWAYEVLNNWRASHSFPLNNFTTNLRSKVKTLQTKAIVAQRIKRLESIIAKLHRGQTSTLKLSQMQDIGGCRVILKSTAYVERLLSSYKNSTFKHVLIGERNYILTPKADGYRGVHLIYQYKASNQITSYDKLRIEIQIRTDLQHAWATAVEAVGIFTQHALKANEGDADWLRLFALVSSAIALIEKTPIVPNTPSDPKELRQEIITIATRLNAVMTLNAHRNTVKFAETLPKKKAAYLLVHYDFADKVVYLSSYAEKHSRRANFAYTEKEKGKKPSDTIVLVRVNSLKALTKAYPNFFLDTGQFTSVLQATIDSDTQHLLDGG
jgi:ppGpp synthetase/RelA/SpoT-type nucleotidyltranferase